MVGDGLWKPTGHDPGQASRPTPETLAHISARTGRPIGYFLGDDALKSGSDPATTARRAVDNLRQASWSLGQLLHEEELTEPERAALMALLTSVRLGIRLVVAVREARQEGEPAGGAGAE